jgi:hypothetical protein
MPTSTGTAATLVNWSMTWESAPSVPRSAIRGTISPIPTMGCSTATVEQKKMVAVKLW